MPKKNEHVAERVNLGKTRQAKSATLPIIHGELIAVKIILPLTAPDSEAVQGIFAPAGFFPRLKSP
jgi:hypothetical protein